MDKRIGHLSFYSIYRDEDKGQLKAWLKNCLQFKGEIILIDSSQKGINVDLAGNIKIYRYEQKHSRYDNSWQQVEIRNFALSKCTQEFIIQLDIDERLDKNFDRVFWREHAERQQDYYAIPTLNLWEDKKEIRVDSYFFPDLHYRIFRNGIVEYIGESRHCYPNIKPDVRINKTIPCQPYIIPYLETSIIHMKYLKPTWYNGKIRCCRRDVESLDEYYKGVLTLPYDEVLRKRL